MNKPLGASDDIPALFRLAPFHEHLGASIETGTDGVTLVAVLRPEFAAIPGRAHGGIVAALLDSAATWSLIAQTGEIWATVDLRIDYLRPVPLARVHAVGRVGTITRTFGHATAELRLNDDLLATATGTFTLHRDSRARRLREPASPDQAPAAI